MFHKTLVDEGSQHLGIDKVECCLAHACMKGGSHDAVIQEHTDEVAIIRKVQGPRTGSWKVCSEFRGVR